jgi:hypothetical protein
MLLRNRSSNHLPTHPPGVASIMNRSRFIEHGGKRMLLLDYSGLGADAAELQAEMDRSKQLISGEEPGTVLTICDVRGSKVTPTNVKAMQQLVKHNTPFVRWGAVVIGLTGVYLTAFRATQALSRRKNLRSFGDLDEAKEWLATQP